MNKTKYFVLLTTISLLCPLKINAACTEEEIKQFKEAEEKYKVTY